MRGKEHVGVAHADSDIVYADGSGSAERHFAWLSQADHIGVSPLVRLDTADKKLVGKPEVIDLAEIAVFLVVSLTARGAVEQICVGMIVHGLGVAEKLV